MPVTLRSWSAAAGCAVVVFVGWISLEIGGPVTTRVFDDLALGLAALVAAASCFVRGRAAPAGDRLGWWLLSLSCFSWAAGQGAWTIYQDVLNQPTPFPSVADIGYVLCMPLAGWAILSFAGVQTRVSRLRAILDGFLVAGSLGCLSWFTVLDAAWQAPYDGPLAKALALAYPLGQAAAACLVIVVLGRCRRHRLPLLMVGAGILTAAATDTAYAYLLAQDRYRTGDIIDVGWLVSFALIALATRIPADEPTSGLEHETQPLWSLLVPYAPVGLVTGFVMVTIAVGGHLDHDIVVAVMGLIGLVLIRHCLTMVEQKGVEAELRASGRRLNEAQQLTHIGNWEWNLATHDMFFSDELCRIHGIEPASQNLTFLTYPDLVHPDDRARVLTASNALARGDSPADIEYRVVRADGAVRWLHGRSTAGTGAAKPAIRYGTIEDITDRKVAEDALRFQARLLQAIGQAVVATDPQGRITYWNGASEALYGWSADEIVGAPILDIIPPDTVDRAMEIMDRLNAGESWTGQFLMQRRDGSRFLAMVTDTPVLDDQGALVAVIGTSIDITEQQQAVTQLRASEERFRQLVEASPLAILEVDDNGRVRQCNEAAVATFGGPADGAGENGAVDISRHVGLKQVLARVAAGEKITDYEVWASREDGALAQIELAANALRNPAGDVTGAIVVGADVSHRKSLEARLVQAQKLEAVGRLAGGFAHDFNNLLTIMLGYSDVLLDQVGEGEIRRGLETIRGAAERGASLTERLLTFSRKRASTTVVVDLNEAVLSVRDLLSRILGEDLTVEAKTLATAGCVSIERSELDQVLLNLVFNSRDAMPDGGSLVITTSRIDIDQATVGPWTDIPRGAYAVLTVVDTGAGMEPEILANCFEPFFTTKTQGKGTGLGLATVYGSVSAAGGHMRVDSSPGEGSAFTILLPAMTAPTPPSPEEAATVPTPSPNSRRRTVLVVEDEDHVRALAVAVLEQEGYRVLGATNGRTALDAVAAAVGVVDVLVTDVVMPELGGVDLARELVRRQPQLGVVFMSGYTDRVLPELRPGEKPWLVEKPFQPGALARTVGEVLARADATV